MAIFVNDDVGEERNANGREGLLCKACIKHLNSNVLNTRTMFIEVCLHCSIVAGAEQNN